MGRFVAYAFLGVLWGSYLLFFVYCCVRWRTDIDYFRRQGYRDLAAMLVAFAIWIALLKLL